MNEQKKTMPTDVRRQNFVTELRNSALVLFIVVGSLWRDKEREKARIEREIYRDRKRKIEQYIKIGTPGTIYCSFIVVGSSGQEKERQGERKLERESKREKERKRKTER